MDEYLTQYSINWKLILGDSPWWGRFYERMAQIVKMSLHKLIGKVKLCYEELETVSTHIESVINTRPSTFIIMGEICEPLRQSNLI